MSSFVRRAAFALAFLDYNVLGSGAIESDSQMLWVRNVRDRLVKLAPFLSYDGDPYPVVVDGRVKWVVDAYTTTSRYPYAQRIGNEVQLTRDSDLDRDANYVRNSVKAVVDAYDGSVTFYVNDDEDPIVQAWAGRVRRPVHAAAARCPPSCATTCATRRTCSGCRPTSTRSTSSTRRTSSSARGRGRSPRRRASIPARRRRRTTAATAPTQNDEQAPTELASESTTSRFTPYYTMFADPTGEGEDFVLLRPFVPFSRADQRTELQAYMTASSDPGDVRAAHRLRRRTRLVDGPRTVSNLIDSEPSIAQQITLQTGGGNRVRFGDLQLVPVADGLLWVRPFYASVAQTGDGTPTASPSTASSSSSYNDRAGDRRVARRGAGASCSPGSRAISATASAATARPPETAPETETPSTGTPAEMLAEADQLFDEADQALEAQRPGRVPGEDRRGAGAHRPGAGRPDGHRRVSLKMSA